jgi:predicted transglutaminase-like cysteine proteinase
MRIVFVLGYMLMVALPAHAASMVTGASTTPPVGYAEFCRNFADQCVHVGKNTPRAYTAKNFNDLQEVDTFVNSKVKPATDQEIYHRAEVWSLPAKSKIDGVLYGDCEDYVLLKRKLLIDRGWPTSDLLVTVVFDEVGDGHAVLVARTTRGDFVLDNKNNNVRAWEEVPYRFTERQSVKNPNKWVSLKETRPPLQVTATLSELRH